MDPDERIGQFAGPGLSPGLQQASARWNQQAPRQFTPTSVLNQFGPSRIVSNSSAAGMDSRMLMGGVVAPNVNQGSSSETAQNAMLLRMQDGQDEA